MRSEPRGARAPVWALSISLAATLEITVVFFSSGYLDVSVHRVPPVCLWIQHTVTEVSSAGFPHSDTRGSAYVQLPAAFRSLSRLSSALSAKASTLRSFSLDRVFFTPSVALLPAGLCVELSCSTFLLVALFQMSCLYRLFANVDTFG